VTTDTRCIHGELDAVCRACCDPLSVSPVDDWDQEWHREQRRRSGLLAAGLLLVAALVVGIAWWLR